MAASDVFCLPSYREGFGSVVIEAAAAGLPGATYGAHTSVAAPTLMGNIWTSVRPENIQQIGDELALRWDDGTESFIKLETLRRRCPPPSS